jgi:hypothetical protein
VTKLGVAAGLAALLVLGAGRAAAFGLAGHQIIEAAAYKRLLAMDAVPGTGTPGVSGRTLLATLIVTGVLEPPPCFDRAHPTGDCSPEQRLELPLEYWPVLGSGEPDLVLDRQLGQPGQCQHFMARSADGLSPVHPRFGVPGDLATIAYRRCARILGLVFDGILRDPRLASWRLAGAYVLMHGLEDSYSAAHAARDEHGAIVHLLSWSLIDWPRYFLHGRFQFPDATHHRITDPRDDDFLRWDGRARDGRSCRDFQHPYAVPAECLTDRATAAVDAVVDYLVLLYRARTPTLASGIEPTIFAPDSPSGALWLEFMRAHLPSLTEITALPDAPAEPKPRPDLFLGAEGSAGRHTSGVGLWASRFLIGPAIPFVLAPALSVGYAWDADAGHLNAVGGVGLLLPLVRRLAIGATPAALKVTCDPRFSGFSADVVARLGNLLVPLSERTWLGIEGPVWSWTDRRIGDTWVGVALGWSQERVPEAPVFAPNAIAAWNPPRPDEVHTYRWARATRVVYLATTAGSRPDNDFVGAGLDMRLDRDGWNHHAGFGPGLEVEVDAGSIEGTTRAGAVALAPTARYYFVRDRLAVTATPALVRVGVIADRVLAADVAARAGLALDLGRVELSVQSPPLSYVSQSRWHALPITARLGLSFD